MDYFLLYFSSLFIVCSVIGYGFLLARIVNKDLLYFNLGYIGLLGFLILVILSYTTIFFYKHNYVHNLIVHAFGITTFLYYYKKKNLNKEFIKLLILFTIFFGGLLILNNHDDFSYYHLTYSLGLTENKLFLGLGNLGHGYRHHSSLFFLNSILYLPFIKFYLFHSVGWVTLVFVNFIILNYILKKKNLDNFDFEFIFYLISFVYINIKFYRVGAYGTDIAGQLILFIILPIIYSICKDRYNISKVKTNIEVIILLITYLVTIKSFFVLNILFLFSLFAFFKLKELFNYFLFSRSIIISLITLFLLSSINFAYTGCAIYPLKQTCLSKHLVWGIEKKEVEKSKKWISGWSKAAAGPNFRVKDPENYIKKFNWVSNWYKKYFLYKGLENISAIFILSILLIIIFYRKNKEPTDKIKKKNTIILFLISSILFFEWFYNHPALRYGGYFLLCFVFFIPTSYFISGVKIKYITKKILVLSLVIISVLVFNIRNIVRIDSEFKRFESNSFPLFYVPKLNFKTVNLENNIKVHIPKDNDVSGCWAVKTPCVGGIDNIETRKKYGFSIFIRKN